MNGLDALAMACDIVAALDVVPAAGTEPPEEKHSMGGLPQRPISDHGSAPLPAPAIESHRMQMFGGQYPETHDDAHSESGGEEGEEADGGGGSDPGDDLHAQHHSPCASTHHHYSPRKDRKKEAAAPKYRRHKSKVIIKTNKVVYLPTTFMEESFDISRLPIDCTMVVEANGQTVERHRVSIKAIPRQGLSTMYCMTNVMDFQQHYLHWQITHWTKVDDQHIKIHLQAPNSSSASSLMRSASTPVPRPGQVRRPPASHACEPLSGQTSVDLHDVANTAGLVRSLSAGDALHDGTSTDGSASDMGGDVLAGGQVRRSARSAHMTPHMLAVLQQEKMLTGEKRLGKRRNGLGSGGGVASGGMHDHQHLALRKRKSQELLLHHMGSGPLDAALMPGGPRCIITAGHSGGHCRPGWEPSVLGAHMQQQVTTNPPRLPGALSLFGSTDAGLHPATHCISIGMEAAPVNVGILGPSMPSRAVHCPPMCGGGTAAAAHAGAGYGHSDGDDGGGSTRSPSAGAGSSDEQQPGFSPATSDSGAAQPGMLQPDLGSGRAKEPAPGWMSDRDKSGASAGPCMPEPSKLITTGVNTSGTRAFKRFRSGGLYSAGEAEQLETGSTTSGTPASATTTCSLGLPVSSFFSAGSRPAPLDHHMKGHGAAWSAAHGSQPALGLPSTSHFNPLPYHQECSSEAGMRALLASWSQLPLQPSAQIQYSAAAQAWAMLGMHVPGMHAMQANPSSILTQAFLDMFPAPSDLTQQQPQRQQC